MLNKEEKRIIDSYILPALEKFNDIYFNCDKTYEDVLKYDGIPESEYNKKVFPYRKVMSDMWDAVNDIMGHLNNIRDGTHTKPVSWENRSKRRESQRNKKNAEEDKIGKEAYKKGREMAVLHYEYMKQNSRKSETKKKRKEHKKSYDEGFNSSKEFYQMDDNQILRKARLIELNRELGYGKKKIKDDKNDN